MNEKMGIQQKAFVLFKIVLFYFIAIYVYQYFFLKMIVWPFIHFIINEFPAFKGKIESFIKLDYGRIIGRIAQFVWVFVLFVLYSKYIDKISIKNTALFPSTSKSKYFTCGTFFGTILVCITITLTLITKSISLKSIGHISSELIPTAILYVFAMLMTAFTEEIIVRGYVLNNFIKIMNPHLAIFLTSIIFGAWHIEYSYLYAAEAFLFSLIAGYGFFWTRNLYFCIGLHFGWNFIESVIYSQSLFTITVYNKFLAGAKNITPDREGILSLPALIIGFLILCIIKKIFNNKNTKNIKSTY